MFGQLDSNVSRKLSNKFIYIHEKMITKIFVWGAKNKLSF